MQRARNLKKVDPDVYDLIKKEIGRQNENIELIASENFTSQAVLEAQGSVLTNKYAEGYPGARYYGGCEFVDIAETLAIERAKELFGAEHANVQAHSGTQANMAVYFAALKFGDCVLALDLACGGHLSHGHRLNFSGMCYRFVGYGLNPKTEQLDYDMIESLAKEHKPKMILAGASAYPRTIDFKKFREICDKTGSLFFVDMAHIAGLVAAGLHPSPFPHADFVTTTTHKTLRGPRGGVVFCRKEYAKSVDKYVFPGLQGGPLMHIIAAKAVAFKEALTQDFKDYQKQILANARALSDALAQEGFRIVSGGTDNHLMLVDVTTKGVSGKEAETCLDKVHITVNKNLIPFDTKSPMVASGIRVGTPAVTTRGMKEKDMVSIASLIHEAVSSRADEGRLSAVRNKVKKLTGRFPLYPLFQKAYR